MYAYVPIPLPEENFDTRPYGENLEDQRTWADAETRKASSISAVLGDNLPPTATYLQQESDAVAGRELGALFADELHYLQYGDGGYATRLCTVIGGINKSFSVVDNVNQVIEYLDSVAAQYPQYAQPSSRLAAIISDAVGLYQKAFGNCIDQLRPPVAIWILEVISRVFCPAG
jgi:hypothetical protein